MRLLTAGSLVRVQLGEPKNPLSDVGIFLSSRAVASQVFSALQGLTSVFGMGTGGPPASSTPTVDSEYSFGSPSWTRTNDPAVNSRMLYRVSVNRGPKNGLFITFFVNDYLILFTVFGSRR